MSSLLNRKMIFNINNRVAVSLLALLLCFGCTKKLDAPGFETSPENHHWESITDTKSGLMGLYGLMRTAMVSNYAHWAYGDFRLGEFQSYSRMDLESIMNNDLKRPFSMLEDLSNWRRFYAAINAANLFIERAPEVLEKDVRYTRDYLEMDLAQARAIRAFLYFYMARIWNNIPLITQSYDNSNEFPQIGPSTQAQVMDFAYTELVAVSEFLPFQYGVAPQNYYEEQSPVWMKVLFNKLTAYAVLAHISAWQGKYVDVDAFTSHILNETNFGKSNLKYNAAVTSNSSGTIGLSGPDGIFSTTYGAGQLLNISASYAFLEGSREGHIEELTLAAPFINRINPQIFVPKDVITELFTDPNDTRFGSNASTGEYTEVYFKNFTTSTPIFAKININKDKNFAEYGSNLVFTRLEEIKLLRAEALYVLGRIPESIQMLNDIKVMRKVSGYTITMLESKPLLREILNERKRELMGEGWSFYDQVRFNRIETLDPAFKELMDKGGIYWPISKTVLSNNAKIQQNEYWK